VVPSFIYMAVDRTGRKIKGQAEALNRDALIERIQSTGQILLRADEVKDSSLLSLSWSLGSARRPTLNKRDVAYFSRELAIMLCAGQDLDHALRFLSDTAPNAKLSGIYAAIREKVRSGSPLHVALADQPGFSRLYVALVQAGESSGTLGPALDHLATLLERERSLAASIQSAMIYPTVLLIAAIGSIALLLGFVLPQFKEMFDQAGAKLPAITQVVIGLGDAVRAGWSIVIVLGVVGALGVRQALRQEKTRIAIDGLLLRLPVVGPMLKEIEASRFTRTLGTLLVNGVSILTALSITRNVAVNRIALAGIEGALVMTKEGRSLSQALAESSAFPIRAIHLLGLGEQTGRLGELSLRAALIHEEQVQHKVQRLVSLLVPVITILMGAAVATIISSLMLAMLSLNDVAF
jgi:general secretion pathway protein F